MARIRKFDFLLLLLLFLFFLLFFFCGCGGICCSAVLANSAAPLAPIYTGDLKPGALVPWEIQVVNTLPDNFIWEKDKTNIIVIASGLYEVVPRPFKIIKKVSHIALDAARLAKSFYIFLQFMMLF